MARRGENIFKRKDGRWEARVLEYRENGSKAYRSLYGKSYTEVKAKKEEYYGAVHKIVVLAVLQGRLLYSHNRLFCLFRHAHRRPRSTSLVYHMSNQ